MFWSELIHLKLYSHKTGKQSIVEQQVDEEIRVADLNAVLLADKGKVLAQLKNELLQICDNAFAEILLFEGFRQIEKLKNILEI